MNSTELLEHLEHISDKTQDNIAVDISVLAKQLDISVLSLVSILTELEQRDEIILNISSVENTQTNELEYSGTVQLMSTPPDEEDKNV